MKGQTKEPKLTRFRGTLCVCSFSAHPTRMCSKSKFHSEAEKRGGGVRAAERDRARGERVAR